MRYVYLLVFVYLSVLFVFSSCEREDLGPAHNDACIEDNNAFEDMKAWYYFKQGTYWVYQEQNSGQLDTVIVYQDAVNQFDTIYQFEWYATSSQGDHYHQWVNTSWAGPCSTREFCFCQNVFVSRSNNGEFVGQNAPFFFPHFVSNYAGNMWPGGKTILTDMVDSVQWSNQIYYEVASYYNEIDALQYDLPAHYQFAKNVGMISRVVTDLNEDWRLVEYSVVK